MEKIPTKRQLENRFRAKAVGLTGGICFVLGCLYALDFDDYTLFGHALAIIFTMGFAALFASTWGLSYEEYQEIIQQKAEQEQTKQEQTKQEE